MTPERTRETAEERFRSVFSHLAAVRAYARRRGSRDPDGIAAEAMTIAWRRLDAVPLDDPRPWLYATARNLVLAEARDSAPREAHVHEPRRSEPAPEVPELDPAVGRALASLSDGDREALLLVAWEDLTPTQAAKALGINPTAFRVRLLRARKRFRTSLEATPDDPGVLAVARFDVEGT